MKNLKIILITAFILSLLSSCQTLKEKTDIIVEKENQKLSNYIGKSLEILKIELGNPDEDYKNEKGNIELVYRTKKYGISCERKFEIDKKSIIIGFVSKGCF
tara:strand:- start:49 stop:354 length:306 start_codon:yes stop_codon:yes gene_type:complete